MRYVFIYVYNYAEKLPITHDLSNLKVVTICVSGFVGRGLKGCSDAYKVVRLWDARFYIPDQYMPLNVATLFS